MTFTENIGKYLDQIKNVKGVENVVLTQRDGHPIHSTGVWFSEDELFNVSSATSAIYNVSIHLHPIDLKYVLLEGKKAKILIAPLKNSYNSPINRILSKQKILDNDNEFFIAITTLPNINLGEIFLRTKDALMKIKTELITSGENFKPPLIEFNEDQVSDILDNFSIKEDVSNETRLSSYSLGFSKKDSEQLNKIFASYKTSIPDLKYSFLTIDGGFVVSKIINKVNLQNHLLESNAAMSYSLFQTSNRVGWLLKKMQVSTILIDCESSFQFIYGIKKGIFSSDINKGKYKLGLLRLIIPRFAGRLQNIVENASIIKNYKESFDIKKLLGELRFDLGPVDNNKNLNEIKVEKEKEVAIQFK